MIEMFAKILIFLNAFFFCQFASAQFVDMDALIEKAKQGNIDALEQLGECYYKGVFVEKDYTKAIPFLKQAAEKGSPKSMFYLYQCYNFGRGVPENEHEATSYLRKAAIAGHEFAFEHYVERFPYEKDEIIILQAQRKDLYDSRKAPKSTSSSELSGPFSDFTTLRLNDKIVNVKGVKFKMVCVQGGTFLMGDTMDQFHTSEKDEKPSHCVAISTYYMGETEVTQELWEAVMGTNPSDFKNPKAPVEMVSWNDCQLFISKLNEITGFEFRLPTEAEWEFAARGGCFSGHWMYAGNDFLDGIGWWVNNAKKTMIVKQKQPNELGFYDMSGNVSEWCYDWFKEYTDTCFTNPTGPKNGKNKIKRGGHWNDSAKAARVAFRSWMDPSHSNNHTGMRLAASITQKDIDEAVSSPQLQRRCFKTFNTKYLGMEKISVNGVDFNMIGVQGGCYLMGATLEQTKYGHVDEQPCHNVTLSSFRIGQTEVPQKLWIAIMNNNPSTNKGDDLPVDNVSYDDCMAFIDALNKLTGRKFRLPTEAEWEYAARGGNISRQYSFPGNNESIKVAWSNQNCTSTKTVAKLEPNELNIFDMGGNVAEWCYDWYSNYSSNDDTNPKGPSSGKNRVIRGGHWKDGKTKCHISSRSSAKPNEKAPYYGLRLAL